jgi:hypothetical protein
MTSSDSTAPLDMKLYMLVSKATEKSLTPQTIVELDDINLTQWTVRMAYSLCPVSTFKV